MVVIGLELRTASILHNNVTVSSHVSNELLLILRSCLLADFTLASQRPQKLGADGEIKCHSTLYLMSLFLFQNYYLSEYP